MGWLGDAFCTAYSSGHRDVLLAGTMTLLDPRCIATPQTFRAVRQGINHDHRSSQRRLRTMVHAIPRVPNRRVLEGPLDETPVMFQAPMQPHHEVKNRSATRELSVASFPRRTPPPAPSVSSEIRSVRRAPPCLAPIFAFVPYFPHFLSPAIYNTQDGLIYRIPQGQIRESSLVPST